MPQRFLRPGITNSQRFNSVSLHAQTLWVRILTRVDDFGRYDARASVLAGELFSVWNELHPEDVVNPQRIPALRSELQRAGLAEFYTSEGKEVVQLLQWEERARASKSKWPDPQDSAAERSGTQRNPASLASTSSPVHQVPIPAKAGKSVDSNNGHPVKDFIAAWHDAYLEVTGKKYIMVKGADSGQAKRLLEGGTDTAEIIGIARRAWIKDGFWCKQAHQIKSFVTHIGNIRNELDPSAKATVQSTWKNPMA